MKVVIGLIGFLFAWGNSGPQSGIDADIAAFHWEEFYALPEAHQSIEFATVDNKLLTAAVFYLSNQVREEHGLRPFDFDPDLQEMALYHTKAMAQFHFMGHYNEYEPKMRTPAKRAWAFNANFTSENVGRFLLYQLADDQEYYAAFSEGKNQFFDLKENPVPKHTYWSFAEAVLQAWLDSPSHRRNLLNPQYGTLGCAVSLSPGEQLPYAIPVAYATQNFGPISEPF
ncbi:MAG: CAP domain-containing protein [Bacteroidota bacterium]